MAKASPTSPEDSYRQFALALLKGAETEIAPLILPNDDAQILWQGPYPENVAVVLAEQYRTMEISRTEGAAHINSSEVELMSSAIPISLKVRRIDGSWKVDAGPLIELREAAKKIRASQP